MSPRSRGRWAPLGWMVAGGVLVLLLTVDPLGLHPVDDWLRGESAAAKVGSGESGTEGREVLFYRNPMDPTITSPVPMQDEMGMDYLPVYAQEDADSAGEERQVLFYRNPMDPTITSPVPMQDEMGMDYVAVYADGAGAGSAGAGSSPVVSVDPAVVQNMNVRTAPAELRQLEPVLRTVGSLEFDAERVVTVTTRYSGFVEKVYVNYVGEAVWRGQPLFEVYSPELVQTQQELLSAVQYAARFRGTDEQARHHAMQLVEAARTRLGYWDISQAQIERLEESGQVQRTLTVHSPASGVVMERMEGLEGMAVRSGLETYKIADLSTLWVGVELFESQMAWARVGTPVDVVFNAFPDESHAGLVRFIEPQLSAASRTLKVKVEVENPGGRLRPGMFATVHFQPLVGEPVVAVPTQSVIRTGSRSLVIVDLGDGRFQPREVHLGREAGGWSEVHGLEAGEIVVTSSQFLLDSEASIQAVVQGMLSRQADAMPEKQEMPGMSSMSGMEGMEGMEGMDPRSQEPDETDHSDHGDHR